MSTHPISKIGLLNKARFIALAPLGVCMYIAGFAIPFYFDIPLIVLAFTAILSAPVNSGSQNPPLVGPLVIFLIATGLSILFSQDISRSLRLSVALLPALLIFFLIVERFELRHLRLLYVTLSATALGLAATLLWIALCNPNGEPSRWMRAMGSPILLVPNDITFLATIFPFSMALLCQKTPRLVKNTAFLSIFLSILVICLLRSRVALLTLIVTSSCMVTLMRPRFGLVLGAGTVLLVLLIDGMLGFPLLAKHESLWDTRLPLWLAAWRMFLDAPLFGHGPHTFVLFYQSYLHNLVLPDWLPVDTRLMPWPHNLYVEMLAEQGLLGLVGLATLLSCVVSLGLNTFRASQGEVRIYAASIFASLAGFCVAAAFELSFLRQWVIVMLFILLGVSGQLSFYINTKGNTDEINKRL